MNPTDPARQFWRAVLADGGLTAIPRWTLEPAPGIAGHEVPVPEDHLASARRLAADLGVTLEPVLLAAHAKVLAALSGETEVMTGYVPGGDGRPLPCRLTTGPATWRALVNESYSRGPQMLELTWERALTRPQVELIAAHVSRLQECFY